MQPDSVSIFTSKNDGFFNENKIMYPLDFLKKSSADLKQIQDSFVGF